MILSKACDYGLRASLYIATRSNQNYIPIREISSNLNISFHFLTKILQKLTEKNIMASFRGPHGGVKFTRPISSISLLEIITAIDGPDLFEKCLIGLDDCRDDSPCPLHDQWKTVRTELMDIFQNNSLETISWKILNRPFRISDLQNSPS